MINRLADLVIPYPVAVLDVRKATVVYVNDSHFRDGPAARHSDSTILAQSHNEKTHSPDGNEGGSGNNAPQEVSRSNDRGDLTTIRQTSSGGSLSGASSHNRSITKTFTSADSVPKMSSTDDSRRLPFIGILKISDSLGVSQTIKIIFYLQIRPPMQSTQQVTSLTTIESLQVVLPTSSEGPLIPHLRPERIHLRVGPSKKYLPSPWPPRDYVAFDQYPKMGFFEMKISKLKSKTFGISSAFSATGSIGLGVTGTDGSVKERIPLSELLNIPETFIGEDERSREHYWRYAIRHPTDNGKLYGCTIELPDHRSQAKFRRKAPVKALTTMVIGSFEINPTARPTKIYKNRARMKVLSIGYKHVRVTFAVEIHKASGNDFVQFGENEIDAPTVCLEHKFPPSEEAQSEFTSDSVSEHEGVAIGTMSMKGF